MDTPRLLYYIYGSVKGPSCRGRPATFFLDTFFPNFLQTQQNGPRQVLDKWEIAQFGQIELALVR